MLTHCRCQADIELGRRDLHAACKSGFASGPLLALRHSLTDAPWSGAAAHGTKQA